MSSKRQKLAYKRPCPFCSQLTLQFLEWCLVNSRCSINICWMNLKFEHLNSCHFRNMMIDKESGIPFCRFFLKSFISQEHLTKTSMFPQHPTEELTAYGEAEHRNQLWKWMSRGQTRRGHQAIEMTLIIIFKSI